MDIHAVRADDLRYLVALANTGRLVAAATDQTAAILLSSFTPALATALIVWSGGALWPIIVFASGTTAVAMVAVSFAPDRRSVALDQIGD
jgi:hypothetical protein